MARSKFSRIGRVALATLILAVFAGAQLLVVDGRVIAKGKPGGGGGGNDGGVSESLHVLVRFSGSAYWQEIPGNPSTTLLSVNGGEFEARVARLSKTGDFIVNNNNDGGCAESMGLEEWNRARTNLNFITEGEITEGDPDTCLTANVENDRVYGATLKIQNTSGDLTTNDDSHDIQLNIPDSADEKDYRLWYSVTSVTKNGSEVDLSSGGLEAALRALEQDESLEITLGNWELAPVKNFKNSDECVASGSFDVLTTMTITRDDTPCDGNTSS